MFDALLSRLPLSLGVRRWTQCARKGAAWMLLVSACSLEGGDGTVPGAAPADGRADLQDQTPPASSSTSGEPSLSGQPAEPLGEPTSDTLLFLGGQTGSDMTAESAAPCPLLGADDYMLAAQTPLGFSGADVIDVLGTRPILLRWAEGEAVGARLGFSSGPRATLLRRATSVTAGCIDVLRLDVTVTLSSDEFGIDGTWTTQLFARARDEGAGVGIASADALGAELSARSGDPDALTLTYELGAGSLQGWLSSVGPAPSVLAALRDAE